MLPKLAVLLVYWLGAGQLYAQTLETRWLHVVNAPTSQGTIAVAKTLSYTTAGLALLTPVPISLPKFADNRRAGWTCLVEGYGAIAVASGISYGLKRAIHRERPYQTYPGYIIDRAGPKTYSFPSGHTTTAFCAATYATLNCPRWYVAVPAYTYAAGVAWARMRLGAHYPSDIAVGVVIGTGTALGFHYLGNYIRKQTNPPSK